MGSAAFADPPAPPAAPSGIAAHGWWVVAGAVGATTAACWAVDRHLSLTVQAMAYLVAVVIVAHRCSRAQSATAAIASVLALNLFFVPPRGLLTVDSAEHLLTLVALLAVALLISSLAADLRRETERAVRRERRARQLQGLAGELAAAGDEIELTRGATRRLDEACGAPVVLALLQPGGGLHDAVGQPLASEALTHCIQDGRMLGPGTSRWPELAAWYVPLRDGKHTLGAVEWPVQTGVAESDEERRQHAQAMCDLVSSGVQRVRHAARALVAVGRAHAEQQRSALLASVSHDFRTPLASIVGAVSSLTEQRDRLTEADRERLLSLIAQEADYLVTTTENTLQWARLSSEQRSLRFDWQSIEEIVGAVLARVRRRDPARRVHARVAPDLPLVRADPSMLAQLLENLLDNALKYSDGPIDIDARVAEDGLQVCVKDRGPGLDHDEVERIFDSFVRGARARGVRGSGLGLAVCRTIAQAHGGTLGARRRNGGGTSFVLVLPADEAPAVPAESLA